MDKDKIKRLEQEFKKIRAKPDTGVSGRKKVDLLNDLAYALHTSNPKKTEDYAKQALVMAEKMNYKKGIARSHQLVGLSYWPRGDYDTAVEYYNKSIRMFKQIGDRKGIAASYGGIGIIYNEKSDYLQALKYHLKSLNVREQIGDKKGIAATCTNIGFMYNMQSDYEQALKYHLKALEIGEEIGDRNVIATAYSNIGNIYHYQSDHAHALEYYRKSLKIRKAIGAKNDIAISYNNIGICYEKQGDYERALEYHFNSLEIREQVGDKHGIATSYNNIGCIYEIQSDYARALEYYRKALKITEQIGEKHYIARSYNSIASVQIRQKHYDSALIYLQKGLHVAQEIRAKYPEMNSYKKLSELHEAEQNYEQALCFHKKYTVLEKEIFNAEKSKQIAEMHAKYETEKKSKEAEVYHLKNVKLRKEIKERKKAEQELQKHREHLEKLVEERTKQLRSLAHELSLVEEKQRRKIATYLHDDIAQALALATVRLELLRDMVPKKNIKKELEEIKEIIDQTTARTRSLTFEISPPVLYDSGFEPAVEWLAEQFQNQHDIVCELKNDGLPKPVSSDTKVILFQSVRELLTNVAKHAQARTVRVLTLKKANSIRIEVTDDGIGFNTKILNQKITKNEGFGLFNLKERLRHLHGKLEVSSTAGKGTSVAIVAPLKSSRKNTTKKRRRA